MNETIGVKGGKRDRRRSMIISREKKKKLQQAAEDQEIRELEKRVKKKQLYTLIKALPIVIGGGVVQTIHDTAVGKKPIDIEEENSRWRIKEYDADITSKTPQEDERERRRKKIIVTPTGQKVVVYVHNDLKVESKDIDHSNDLDKKADHDVKNDGTITEVYEHNGDKKKSSSDSNKPVSGVSGVKGESEEKVVSFPHVGIPHNPDGSIDVSYEALEAIDYNYSDIDFDNLPDNIKDRLQQLKSRKIIDEYERQLKDIRYDLRKLIFEYNVLVDEEDKAVLSREAEIILDRLSEIIDKVEVLKSKIRIEDLDKYDDNYIYVLIEGYLEEFRDGKVISEIKDSPLYIMISSKLDELEEKRGKLDKKVSDKKDRLEEKEESFERMKERYYSIDRLNKDLLDFQNSQDRMLKEIQEKVQNAVTESERVEVQFQGMNAMSRRMLRMLRFQMFLPGPRFARGLAASAAAHLYFLNNILRPNTTTRRYRVITVKDYSRDIENSIEAIDDSLNLLGKTSKQIDAMITEINDKFKDYFGVIKECDEMIYNLTRIKREIEEKEYEMQKIKAQQELELEKNNAKVKTIGEYPVN